MRLALAEARAAAQCGEVPIGAVVVAGGRTLARAHNLTETLGDVTAHAEMQALTSAASALGANTSTAVPCT
ncbi:tRNA-specific adenosine deaminase [Rikenella microfusus]|uniref:tRNA-specific adenosine deaminase n=1 Tax=Rikenella microfusus TaxID=28139 RepID=A0A379ND53_9BACT|nr:tRNA-specific adenosine deaminase [Rikenella microfusus]